MDNSPIGVENLWKACGEIAKNCELTLLQSGYWLARGQMRARPPNGYFQEFGVIFQDIEKKDTYGDVREA